MNKLNSLPERALELAGSVGDSIRQAVPDSAIKWVETGAALTALKTGSKIATRFVKRNPAVAVAAAAGAGLLWYVARRKARQAENGAIEGSSTRIQAKRANGTPASKRPARKRAARSRADSAS